MSNKSLLCLVRISLTVMIASNFSLLTVKAEDAVDGESLRQRVILEQGILLVLEAPAAADKVDGPASRGTPYLLWYRDLRDNEIFLYSQVVRTAEEIKIARRQLDRFLQAPGRDLAERIIERFKDRGTAGRTGPGSGVFEPVAEDAGSPGEGVWRAASLNQVLRLVGDQSPGWMNPEEIPETIKVGCLVPLVRPDGTESAPPLPRMEVPNAADAVAFYIDASIALMGCGGCTCCVTCCGNPLCHGDPCPAGACICTACLCDRCCDGSPCCGSSNPCCEPGECCGNSDRCCNDDNPCCGSNNPCCNSIDPCCGNSNRCCNNDNPCCESTNPCCDSNDPCCGDSNRCCNFDNPCCGDHNPCCNSNDPCCGNPDRCCNSDNPCCGSDNPCCNTLDPCCGNPDECCNPDNPDCDDPCNGVDCDDSNPCTDDSCLDGICFHVEMCPPTLLGRAEMACCVDGECCGTLCCPMACEECLDNGSLTGGIINVEPQVPCLGDTLTFTVSGVVDEGGIKRVDCYAKTAVPAVAPTYTWVVTKPNATTVSGSGPVGTVLVDMLGNYSCTFTATANRVCPPAQRLIGPVSTAPPDDYAIVEIVYKTFIGCEVAGPTPPDFTLYDFFDGDGRGLGYSFGVGQSRTYQLARATVDPAITNGQASGPPLQAMGITKGYDDHPDGSDVVPLAIPTCGGQCTYTFVAGATAECVNQLVDPVGSGKLGITYLRISETEIEVYIWNRSSDQCEYFVPAVNVDLRLRIRQTCNDGVLNPPEYRAYGQYDGYPWHELYLNGQEIFRHDPCVTGENPWSMVGFGEHYFATDGQSNPTPLADWQVVP